MGGRSETEPWVTGTRVWESVPDGGPSISLLVGILLALGKVGVDTRVLRT